MANPERAEPSPYSPKIDLAVALAAISTQLEIADEIENPIERCTKQNDLLEQYDDLQAEIHASLRANSSTKTPAR